MMFFQDNAVYSVLGFVFLMLVWWWASSQRAIDVTRRVMFRVAVVLVLLALVVEVATWVIAPQYAWLYPSAVLLSAAGSVPQC